MQRPTTSMSTVSAPVSSIPTSGIGCLDDVTKAGGDADAYWKERISAIPLKRPQTAEDIAHMFLYLSSPFADNMTGQSINVTGGLILH